MQVIDSSFERIYLRQAPESSHSICAGNERTNWRREWDSNPRYPLRYTRFPSVRLQPLGHLSDLKQAPSLRSGFLLRAHARKAAQLQPLGHLSGAQISLFIISDAHKRG